jgi:uncharacterized protein YdiU (UPF0061 family)
MTVQFKITYRLASTAFSPHLDVMPISSAYRPDPSFARLWGGPLGHEFADPVAPAAFPESIIRWRNERAAASVGLEGLTEEEWLAHFARFEPLADNQPAPLAMRYHGHQFRSYNPDLGDGRGFLFAQLRDTQGRLLDLATKGSGQTPWSRTADGRLTLKGGVREVLAAAMLEALGVPTSKAFSLVETGEALMRHDEPSPTRSSVLTRLSWSHIRFGSFQRHAFHQAPDRIQALADHAVEAYYPELLALAGEARIAALLGAVVARTARLAARWMAAGFVHGVLNTDNMNITGESFDYGPYRFLPHNDPNFTAAYFDHTGLYAFGRQPEACFWNLQRLASALSLVCADAPLIEALNRFGLLYRDFLAEAVVLRLGLKRRAAEEEVSLAEAAFRTLGEGGPGLGWEGFFFDWFGGGEARALQGPRADLYLGEAALEFRKRLAEFAPDRPERLADPYFARPEPETLLYDQIEALWAPIAEADDWSLFASKLEAIETARRAYRLEGDLPGEF